MLGISGSHRTNASIASLKAALLLLLMGLKLCAVSWKKMLTFLVGYLAAFIVFAELLETWGIWNS